MNTITRERRSGGRGVTLVELLVVIAVVAVLAGLLIPVGSQVRHRADDAACLSNLRQIGLGIAAYGQDHGDTLPGPLNMGQYAFYDDRSQLSWILREYLDVNESGTKKRRSDVFTCPAARRVMRRLDDAPSFLVNIYAPFADGAETRPPFGYFNSRNSKVFGTSVDFPALRSLDLLEMSDRQPGSARSRTWALQDADRDHPDVQRISASFRNDVPARPVHGDGRMTLFFDFHAAKAPLVSAAAP